LLIPLIPHAQKVRVVSGGAQELRNRFIQFVRKPRFSALVHKLPNKLETGGH